MEVLLERRSHGLGRARKGRSETEKEMKNPKVHVSGAPEREKEMVTLVAGDVNMHMDQ